MGSLSSRPSVPTTTQAAPAPVVQPPVTTAVEESAAGDTTDVDTQEARTQSLLQRNRSRLGTIQTSFRGLLGGSNNDETTRKRLLGE